MVVCPLGTCLINNMLQVGLMDYIRFLTRITDKDSCLDMIFSNDSFITKAGGLEFDVSDPLS